MKIGIIGSGAVGQTLADGFLKHGHEVRSARATREAGGVGEKNPGARRRASPTRRSSARSWSSRSRAAARRALRAGRRGRDLAGKTVIDATNPIADAPPVNGVLQLLHDPTSR